MATSDADQELLELQRSALTHGHAAGLPAGVADPAAIATWEQRREAQREAYGQFVAAGPIYHGNALAFNTGQQVPLEHVIKWRLVEQQMVNRVATPELARAGRAFESEDDYYEANPHLDRHAPVVAVPEAHPAALDPRGAAAHLDTDAVHGPVVGPDGLPVKAAKSAPARAAAKADAKESKEGAN
jgi:hypothetical protein